MPYFGSKYQKSWWCHQMETFSAYLAICAGNSPVPGEFPTQRPVTRSFDVFFDLRLNKRLSKQPWGWWFETPAWSLWRHRNVVCSVPSLWIQLSVILLPTRTKFLIKATSSKRHLKKSVRVLKTKSSYIPTLYILSTLHLRNCKKNHHTSKDVYVVEWKCGMHHRVCIIV